MTSRDFCFWLQGFFELRNTSGSPDNQLSVQQVETIKRHLALVFKHEIDPQAGPPEVQAALQEIHDGPPSPSVLHGRVGPNGERYRC